MALKNFESNALLLVLEGINGADLSKIKIGSDAIDGLENNVIYYLRIYYLLFIRRDLMSVASNSFSGKVRNVADHSNNGAVGAD